MHKWLLAHPRVQLHFTPTYSSWISQVVRWFAELQRRCLDRGVFCSLDELTTALEDWITIWNASARPFKWTKTADQIIDRICRYCSRISGPDTREAAPRTAEFCGFRLTKLTAGSSSDQRRVLRVVSIERSVLDAPRPAVVTAADMVAGHVTLDISCLDRIYLNGYVAKLQTSGGVVYFFNDHRGKRIVSPALFEPIGAKFRKDMGDWAQANGVPVIRFKAEERKADVVAPYLDAAAAAGRSQVAVIGCAQEFQRVWTAGKHDTGPGRSPQFSFTKEQRRVPVFYIYIWDTRMGPGFIKICTYFPYPVKAWVNGHEWAKRQALAAGISFTELSNGFASCGDPAALQQTCDRFGPGTVQVWFERWMAKLPLPLTTADRNAGFWWELSATFESRPWPALPPPCCSRSPASPIGACAP